MTTLKQVLELIKGVEFDTAAPDQLSRIGGFVERAAAEVIAREAKIAKREEEVSERESKATEMEERLTAELAALKSIRSAHEILGTAPTGRRSWAGKWFK